MKENNNSYKYTCAEYFAGIGLVRMGLEPLGWQIVWANDISDKKHVMYKEFFADSPQHYVIKDIFNIDPLSVPSTTMATCSFPCINLSLAGKMEGIHGKDSSAFWGFSRILENQGEKAPPFVLIENVPGWLNSNNGADFRLTIQSLNDLGYVCDVFTLNALHFTPQSRLRVFVIGSKLCEQSKDYYQIIRRPKILLSKRLKECVLENLDLKWFFNKIPIPPQKLTNGLSNIIEDVSEADPRWWDDSEVDRHLKMMKETHLNRVHTLLDDEGIHYRTFYRRIREDQQRAEVRNDDLSGCLRTAVGGSAKQFLIKIGRGRIWMRAMTPREYARLQGVPDYFPIKVNGIQALTGFGDAVNVPAITWIAQNIINPLLEKSYSEYSKVSYG